MNSGTTVNTNIAITLHTSFSSHDGIKFIMKRLLISVTNKFRLLKDGEMPLAYSFWIYGVIINALCLVLLAASFPTAAQDPILRVSYIAFLVFYIIYVSMITIAVWGSSYNYKGAPIWAILASVTISIVAIISGIAIYALGFSMIFMPTIYMK